MAFPLLVLLVVLGLIAVRHVRHPRLPIWLIMAGGALAVLLSGDIGPRAALAAIDLDVMLFLFGVFVVGRALELSGYLYHLAYRLLRDIRSGDRLLLAVLGGAALASAFLMNDTLAIIGTPLVLKLAVEHRMSPKLMLLALAFAVTLGSVMSPIGNPQNLLIALQGGIASPFVEFAIHLGPPTVINLFLTWWLLRRYFPESFHAGVLAHGRVVVSDKHLARLARWSLRLLVGLALAKAALTLIGLPVRLDLVWIALVAAAPVLVLSPRRILILRSIDWRTLAFFAAMFVLMAAVWSTGFLQGVLARHNVDLSSPGALFGIGLAVSQVISNVPLVALLLPAIPAGGEAGTVLMLALAAGSTLAGNLLILGAASNVIIIQNAEQRGGPSLSFFEFARVGVPVTLANALVYLAFLLWWS